MTQPGPVWPTIPPAPPGATPPTGPAPGAGWAPPVPPPAARPPRRGRGGSGLRAALAGAVAGAAVAAGVAFGVVEAADEEPAPPPARELTTAARLAGEPLDIHALLDKVQPSVVSIRTMAGSGGGAGTGVLLSADGLVVTNAHVIQGATAMQATLFDGTVFAADLVGSSPDDDVALVQLRAASGLVPAELGDSDSLRVGDEVVAIGNALNLEGTPTVTQGIVSARNRAIQAPTGTFFGDVVRLEHLIQTDAAINPGNSGGPLVDVAGRVVGINTAVAGGAQNIGFSIAINAVVPLIEELKAGGGVTARPFLGVTTLDLDQLDARTRARYGVEGEEGAFVIEVTPGSAAEAAGIRAGDVITEVDGQPVDGAADIGAALRARKPGDRIGVAWTRDGQPGSAEAELGSRSVGG